MVVPHEVTELYEEGRMLHHCVGSYGRMVSDGECVVAFIRRKEEEAGPPLHSRNLRQGNCTGARDMQQAGRPDAKGKEFYKTVGERERFNI